MQRAPSGCVATSTPLHAPAELPHVWLSPAAALAAVQAVARILRVHDVAATVDALKVWQAAGLPHR